MVVIKGHLYSIKKNKVSVTELKSSVPSYIV